MALRKIVLQGDECLTKVCRPVTDFNSRLHTLLDDMKETLLDSGGVGLIRYEESHIMGFVCAEDVRERFFPIMCHYNMTFAPVEGARVSIVIQFFQEYSADFLHLGCK